MRIPDPGISVMVKEERKWRGGKRTRRSFVRRLMCAVCIRSEIKSRVSRARGMMSAYHGIAAGIATVVPPPDIHRHLRMSPSFFARIVRAI